MKAHWLPLLLVLCKPLLELVSQGWGAAAAAEAAEAARQPLHAAKAVKHPCKIVVRLKARICTFEAFVGCLALGRCVQVEEDEVAEDADAPAEGADEEESSDD